MAFRRKDEEYCFVTSLVINTGQNDSRAGLDLGSRTTGIDLCKTMVYSDSNEDADYQYGEVGNRLKFLNHNHSLPFGSQPRGERLAPATRVRLGPTDTPLCTHRKPANSSRRNLSGCADRVAGRC